VIWCCPARLVTHPNNVDFCKITRAADGIPIASTILRLVRNCCSSVAIRMTDANDQRVGFGIDLDDNQRGVA
jgi:hypothetical protein